VSFAEKTNMALAYRIVGNITIGEGYGEQVVYDNSVNEVFVGGGYYITVISTTTDQVVGQFRTAGFITSMVLDSGRGEIFVEDTVSVFAFSAATGTVVATVTAPWGTLQGTYGSNLAYDSGKGEIFMFGGNDNISVISDVTDRVVAVIPLYIQISSTSPQLFAFPTVNLLYVSAKGEIFGAVPGWTDGGLTDIGGVVVISDATDQILGVINTPHVRPWELAYDSGKGEILVTSMQDYNTTLISVATDTIVETTYGTGTVVNGGGSGMAYVHSKRDIFIADFSPFSAVTLFNDTTDMMAGTIPLPGLYNPTFGYTSAFGLAYDSAQKHLFVAVPGQAVTWVFVISLGSHHKHNVTFTRTALPPGTEWWVNLSINQSYSSTASNITFQESNGLYNYTLGSANKSFDAAGGNFTVYNANVSVSVAYAIVTYAVTFTETGLSGGMNWSVKMGNVSEHSTSTTIYFNASNGTYAFSVGSITGYNIYLSKGTVIGNGHSSFDTISFKPSTAPLFFGLTQQQIYYTAGGVVVVGGLLGGVTRVIRVRRKP
jgi:hypothetical protein